MAGLIIPKTYVEKIETPMIFLAGPIISAPHWQNEAIGILFSYSQNLTIASPRGGIRDAISQYILHGEDKRFSRQRAWETHYLEIASKDGCVLFWLPGEAEHNCEKVFGAMTRLELGQWMARYKYSEKENARFCIGSDGKFPELETIRYDLSVYAPDKEIKTTLEETCKEAIRLATQ